MRIALGLEKPDEQLPQLNQGELEEINQKIKTFDNDERTAYVKDADLEENVDEI